MSRGVLGFDIQWIEAGHATTILQGTEQLCLLQESDLAPNGSRAEVTKPQSRLNVGVP